MPIYMITTKGEDAKRLVKAESAAQAIRHCAKDVFTAKTVAKVEDAAGLFAVGVKLEDASAPEAAAVKEEPESGQQTGGEGESEGGVEAEVVGGAASGKTPAKAGKAE